MNGERVHHIDIAVPDGLTERAPALPTTTNGLCISLSSTGVWAITHEASGRSIATSFRLPTIIAALPKLDGIDWTLSTDELRTRDAVRAAVIAARESVEVDR